MTTIYHDLTLPLSPQMIVVPADRPPEFEESKSISRGDPYNLTTITFGTHTGTHIDVPKHFYDDGLTIDRLDLDHLLGSARVIEIKGRRPLPGSTWKNMPFSRRRSSFSRQTTRVSSPGTGSTRASPILRRMPPGIWWKWAS